MTKNNMNSEPVNQEFVDFKTLRNIKLPREDYRTMCKDDLEAHLSKLVYEATQLFETLENMGRIRGNGHHARQNLANTAVAELKDRWVEEE